MKSKLNAAWHSTHRMPKNATIKQRINWHVQHQRHCSCRPMPELVKKVMESQDQR